MENLKIDDLGVPLFLETPICLFGGWKKTYSPNDVEFHGDESHESQSVQNQPTQHIQEQKWIFSKKKKACVDERSFERLLEDNFPSQNWSDF